MFLLHKGMSYKSATPMKLINEMLLGSKRNRTLMTRIKLMKTDIIRFHPPDQRHQRSIHYYWFTTSTHRPFTPAVMLLSYIASQ